MVEPVALISNLLIMVVRLVDILLNEFLRAIPISFIRDRVKCKHIVGNMYKQLQTKEKRDRTNRDGLKPPLGASLGSPGAVRTRV